MSYDLMVFDHDAAPRDRPGFMGWYDQQTEWSEDHSYDDPAVCGEPLRAWFLDIIVQFPAMNGPHASGQDDDATVTDYSVGTKVIYAAFAWSQAEAARAAVLRLAERHRVGFFDASADVGGL
ncbi:MAG: hypothetical protein AAF628_36390 [Planctomycetota bacterium]